MIIQPTSGSSSATESNGLRLAICDTAVATTDKIAALDDFELSVGAMINVKFTATDEYNTEINTLNVNNTGAKTIAVYGSGVQGRLGGSKPFCNGNIHTFIYDGTYWVCVTANTWRPVCDDLTSDSTTESLSANQGKVLKGYIDDINTKLDGVETLLSSI